LLTGAVSAAAATNFLTIILEFVATGRRAPEQESQRRGISATRIAPPGLMIF